MAQEGMEIARKDSCKIQPVPKETAILGYTAEFSSEEFQRIMQVEFPARTPHPLTGE